MTTKVILFTGAPENKEIDWSKVELLSEFQDPIARLAGRDAISSLGPPAAPSSIPDLVLWRVVPPERSSAPTALAFSQSPELKIFRAPREPTQQPSSRSEFLTTASLSFASENDGEDAETGPVLSQFYEHSIGVHEGLTRAQLLSQLTDRSAFTSFLSDGITSVISTGHEGQPASPKEPVQFRGAEAIRDLKDLPSASYLTKAHPTTPTCSLVVGIISIAQPRAVTTRWGATKYVVELLVGDETKAGFSITYWLPHANVDKSPLAGLRPQDIVYLQNVGLSAFQNKVYGASQRGGLTQVYLLHRMRLDANDRGGYYSTSDLAASGPTHAQLDKTRRVRDWVLNFVGPAPTRDKGNGRQATRPRWDMPPEDDTQMSAA
ncbi:hypothetical protein VTJ83DRAFT_5556 [Remersonia thermophila]|uniref:Nucleic acid-binding, OB-fold protein n=1 Tax=Remersonia thermophila TaxID=72144 RepID=A0ABR4D9D2_9PEZI